MNTISISTEKNYLELINTYKFLNIYAKLKSNL